MTDTRAPMSLPATAAATAAASSAPAAHHHHDLRPFRHSHAFGDAGEAARSQALLAVTLVTLVTMLAELVAGWWTGSLALTADGWHMGTHAAALGGAVLAMRWSRRARDHEGFAFGGWKIEVLAAYTSALLLLAVAATLAFEAVQALRTPRAINFADAMLIAVLGLLVNLGCAWLLARAGHEHHHGMAGHGHSHADDHGHDAAQPAQAAAAVGHKTTHKTGPQAGHAHDHGHGHDRAHHDHDQPAAAAKPRAAAHHDHNFRAAYVHVLADAATSVAAILALAGGLWLGWGWLDPLMALVGAAVIAHWSLGLLRGTALALVDATAEPALRQAVTAAIESDGDAKLADLHVWQVGPQAWSATLSVVADQPLAAADYHARLKPLKQVRHATIEVHRCSGGALTH